MSQTAFERAVRELGNRVLVSPTNHIVLNGSVIDHDWEVVDHANVIVKSKAEKVVEFWQQWRKRSKLAHFPRGGNDIR